MLKRVLTIFLCLCLLIPAMGLSFGQSVSADIDDYVLEEIGYSISGSFTVGGRELMNPQVVLKPAIDLTQYGYPTTGVPKKGELGLSLDVYIAGDTDLVNKIVSNSGYYGEMEFTSSGGFDNQEVHFNTSTQLKWKANAWNRCVIDLSTLAAAGTGTFNPANWNFFRIFINGLWGLDGTSALVKICNVRLVNLQEKAPSEEEDPIGDGSFTPDPPEWRQVKVADGYCDDDVIVAGYNLAEYVKDHDMEVEDYSIVINSLIDGLSAVGGGSLFIPAGEYDCYSPIIGSTGVTVYGEWANPDDNPKIKGTILKVHEECGAGSTAGTPFLSMKRDSMVKGLTFWYPDQKIDSMKPYPPTIKLDQYNHAKNITFVNSYWAIQQNAVANCPNAENIYGTALFCGMDVDNVIDIMRIENVNFAPDYWINSGLAGAPENEIEVKALKDQLYYNAVGVILRRIDWSYLVYSTIKGYQAGVLFTLSSNGSNLPNGQCNGLLLEDCGAGLYVAGSSGEMIANSVFKNCEYGIRFGEEPYGASLQMIDLDIDANTAAVYCAKAANMTLVSSTIRGGTVGGNCGWWAITGNTFLTEGPQVVLENGTFNASIKSNFDANGKPIKVANEGYCPVSIDNTKLEVPEVGNLTAEQAAFSPKKPANDKATIVDDLDTSGKTDVTAALQAKLDSLAESGGVLYLLPGHYRLDGQLTVPSGVELRGALDVGRIPYNVGTVFDVYATGSEPTVVLNAKSGIRALVFNYPEQYHNALFESEHKFTEYPYAMQGRGEDIYVINVAIRNGWNGLDLMTYKCDNHYVDYLCGVCLKNTLKVGGGSENGVIRNFQFNYNALLQETTYGWNALPLVGGVFEDIMQEQFNNRDDMAACRVGDVENELIYNCFNYTGYAGLQFVGEPTGAANATVVGHGVDYGTVSIDIQDAENITFINTQLTAFNQIGETLTKDMYCIRLGKDFTGKVDMVGLVMWADPTQEFCVENGTLNLYSVSCAPYSSTVQIAKVTGNGKLNLYDVLFNNKVKYAAVTGADKISINGGMIDIDMLDTDQLAQYINVQKRNHFWDVPENADLPDNAEGLWFTDAFTDFSQSFFKGSASGTATVTGRSGTVTMNMGTASSVGVVSSKFDMASGSKNSLYSVELRFNVKSLREKPFSNVMLTAYSNDNDSAYLATLSADGVTVDGKKLCDFELDEYYRVVVEMDLRDIDHKTYQLHFFDNDYEELGASDVIDFPDEFQGEGMTVSQLFFGAMADAATNEEEATTVIVLDYVYATYGAVSCFGTLGDVNGDGNIDSTDARLILQFYAKKLGEDGLNTVLADVNADGNVDSTDARLILQLYAKKIGEFPKA